MAHASPHRSGPTRSAHDGPFANFHHALLEELQMARLWAASLLRRLFEATIRDGIPPPTTFEGLPPGQFPPIDAIKDELFGRPARDRGHPRPFERDVAPGVRILPRGNDRRAV